MSPECPQLDSGSKELRETAAKQKPKPSNVFSSVERRKPVSKELREKCSKQLKSKNETTGLEYHNLEVTDYEYVEKVFKNLRHRLNRSENYEMFDLKTNVLI